ncbi:hypothetical protein FEM48_Zijuj07G0002000 [Ziziphus jujuba var. spinosa]|uniref:PGG domain-containing protein n=1 Tax=Ziziphus jujuba var. spinosa TaxID=714518 RepID=A0A978V1B0_ZIZJJ|nr:hypothetical protein FEM48_Zijuj07G0002000 [Ziziphus jujuba var. spinosa]
MHVIPQICLAPDQEVTALSVFARTPSAFSDESQSSGMFNRFARLCRRKSNHSDHALQIVKEFLKFDEEAQIFDTREAEKSLFIDAEVGIVDFIIKLIELNPNLLWTTDDEKGSFFHVAVQHRQEKIFSLLLELGGIKEEVAKIIPTAYKDMKNSDGKTAQALFIETHKELREEGEKWMKEAAQSSTIVATLIAGAIFAATFSVPGGFDSTSGQPSLIKNKLFVFFSIAETIGLFSSSASILMFLSILTSRYAQNDFLKYVKNHIIQLISAGIGMTLLMRKKLN